MDWDLTPFFESVNSEAYALYERELSADVASFLAELCALAPLDRETFATWRDALPRYEDLASRHGHLMTFIYCMRAYDVSDAAVQRAEGHAGRLAAEMTKLKTELSRAVRDADDSLVRELTAGDLDELSFFVERLRKEAKRTMTTELEGLAADLGTDGISAWGRLYDTVAGQLVLDVHLPDGKVEQVPMAQRRSLMRDADREVRRAAFDAGNRAWSSASDTVAAALNHIAGTRLTLYRHRGVEHFLDVALDQAAISKKTLDAMLEAVDRHVEIPRRFLRLKAKALGLDRLAWYDMEAPLASGETLERISWDRGTDMVRDAFSRYPALSSFFDRALERRWVERSPRPGKAPGAFCATSPVLRESRVFMTYQGALGDVSTLAHEIGHGFHAHILKNKRPLARRYPMTLAESASTFAELILSDGLLGKPELSGDQRVALLGEALGDAAVFLLDITTRFRFEHQFYERRLGEELSVAELSDLMVETQRDVFGDALEEGGEDPLYWASKLHFFITGVSFYNFPYTFGYLLSRGMRAMHQAEGDKFLPRYEAFLAASGQGWAHDVVHKTLGCDLESPEFWETSIISLAPTLDQLERALG